MYKGDAQLPCSALHELGLQLEDWYIQSSTRLSDQYTVHTELQCVHASMVMKEGIPSQ